jgi:hypothetical protein
MPKLRIFLIIVIVLAGIVALWLFGAALMRAFLREARPAHGAARLGEENPPDRNWALGAHAYRGRFHDIVSAPRYWRGSMAFAATIGSACHSGQVELSRFWKPCTSPPKLARVPSASALDARQHEMKSTRSLNV